MQHDIMTLTTATGAVTAYSRPLSGILRGFFVENGDLAAATDIVITDSATGAPILTITNLAADAWYIPTVGVVDAAGAARLFAAGGTGVPELLPIDGTLKFVVSGATGTQTGTVHIYVD